MKNAILYYYQLFTNHVHQTDKQYRFYVGTDEYLLMPCEIPVSDINYIYELTLQLYRINLYCHQFILNKDGGLITYINQIPYVLFRIYYNDKKLVTISDITTFSNRTLYLKTPEQLNRNNWYQMWTDKIDYFEYQITQFGKKFPLIRESFSYFVGLAETAITFLSQLPNDKHPYLVVAHRRTKSTDTMFDLYNPLNFVIDTRIRDASEYFKQKFFENPYVLEDIKLYIENNQLSNQECTLFFARMLFPTFYFDLYEDIIIDHKDEKVLLKIITQINDYQALLRDLHIYLGAKIKMPEIEWILKTPIKETI